MTCDIHGEQEGKGIVCIRCFDLQVARVERESLPLRIANTTEARRAAVVAALAARNGAH